MASADESGDPESIIGCTETRSQVTTGQTCMTRGETTIMPKCNPDTSQPNEKTAELSTFTATNRTDTEVHHLESHSNETFNFPFQPYDVQLLLMKAAYESFEQSKFAILESPTGTGKSLSLICSALTWLKDHNRNFRESLEEKKDTLSSRVEQLKRDEETSADWLSAQTQRQDVSRELANIDGDLERLVRFSQRSHVRWHAKLHNIPLDNVLARLTEFGQSNGDGRANLDASIDDNSKFLQSSQESGSQSSTATISNNKNNNHNHNDASGNGAVHPCGVASASTLEEHELERLLNEMNADQVRPKVYYASRTHSQLGQFVNEVKRTSFANCDRQPPIKVTCLGSRANLCVNADVLKLRDPNAINERCAEMQRETRSDKKCPFAKLKQVALLKEEILSSVKDIEDIVRSGRSMASCPYYATRHAVAESDLVVLPYNNLLHEETRKAASLDLKDNIVIIDEAHNILETICSIHSATITGQQLIGCHTIFSRYYAKFLSRMSPRNAEIVKIVVKCLKALIKYLDNPVKHIKDFDCPAKMTIDDEDELASSESSASTSIQELMLDVSKFAGVAEIEKYNVFRMLDYFNRSQLPRKLLGFFRQDNSLDVSIEIANLTKENREASLGNNQDNQSPKAKKRKTQPTKSNRGKKKSLSPSSKPPVKPSDSTSLEFLVESNPGIVKGELLLTAYPIYALVEFFRSLTNLSSDGKIITNYSPMNVFKSHLRFVLLNPSSQFKQMATEARSVILAGGTMKPFEEFTDLLFRPLGIKEDRLTIFTCGHVIKPSQLCVATLSHGPAGRPLELSFKTRSCLETIDEYGRCLLNISSVAPGGMVCFLPSYDYEQACFKRWEATAIISKIETKFKRVFREPRLANQVKTLLDEYARSIEKGRPMGRGALLFCVVGGKMSEGINFNDELGRCIVMIGLPYANIKSIELQQKMAFYDRTVEGPGTKHTSSSVAPSAAPGAGQMYYENLCIRGVNQSVGRAIRHRDDYAAIVFLDRRYCKKPSIRNGLSDWLRQCVVDHERFGPLHTKLRSFFSGFKN